MTVRLALLAALCLGLTMAAGCARFDPRPVDQAVDDTVNGR